VTKQLPIIGGNRSIKANATASTSLIGRGLNTILNKDNGLARSELDDRYRRARDIYNRITDYDYRYFDDETMPKRGEQIDLFEENPLQPFYDMLRQLRDVFTVFQQLADVGYGKAYFPLASMYEGGRAINKDINRFNYYSRISFEWYFANQGLNDPEIWTDLGRMYKKGLGVERDHEIAVYWYRKAAEQGHANGQYNLGWMYTNSLGVEQYHEQAMFWYEKAAEQGHTQGQFNLGWMYYKGRGVEPDDEEAVFWYRKSAEKGHARGQFNLGWMYQIGYCVELDHEQAVFWYRKAAEQGNAYGPYSLAWMYEYGRGVEQDDEEAVFWYRKAAEQGNVRAKESLTRLDIKRKNT